MADNVVNLFGTCNPAADKYNVEDDGDRNYLLFSSSSGAAVDDDVQVDSSALREHHDRLLPIANVGRIMKQILPPNAKISKEGKETMQECVSEFISFVTGEASDRCHKEKRKTVNGDDICWALDTLGFENYAEPLRAYLNRYRETEGERAGSNTANKASSSSSYIPNKNNNNYGGGGSEITDHHHHPSSSPTLLKFNVMETPNQLF